MPAAPPAAPPLTLNAAELVASTVEHFECHADEIDKLLRNVARMATLSEEARAGVDALARPRTLALARATPRAGTRTVRFLDLGCGTGADAAAIAAAGDHVLVLAADGSERMCAIARKRFEDGGLRSRCRVARFELAAGDYAALRRGIGAFDACLLAVCMSYVPWAKHGGVYDGVRRSLEAGTGILVLADSVFAEALPATLIEGAHHERRPFTDYEANLVKAGFELLEHETYAVNGEAFFVSVWRARAPPQKKKPPPQRKKAAAPSAVPGLP